jgi:hypothetical protein
VLRFALILTAATIIALPAIAEPVSPHAREAVQTILQLRAIGLPDPESIQNGPPANVPGLLRRLNRELRDLIIETLNDTARRGVPSEEEITAQLRAAGWDEIPDHKWNAYGEILEINFDFKLGYEPGILVVSPRLWIPCGTSDPDAARRWELVLAADADFDPQGAEQGSGIQFELSPSDQTGNWFLAIAHAPPSCRSAQPNVRYKIVRPGPSPDKPITLLDRRQLIDSKFDPPFKMRVEPDWFAVTTGRRRILDGEWGISIARYEVKGQQVKRIHPLALSPQDFFDEWVQLSWGDAVRWSSESKLTSLENWHSFLSSLGSDSTEIRVVQACADQRDANDRWLMEVWIDRQLNPTAKEDELYIDVSRKVGIYYVDGIETKRPAGCPGNSPPTQLTDWKLPSW